MPQFPILANKNAWEGFISALLPENADWHLFILFLFSYFRCLSAGEKYGCSLHSVSRSKISSLCSVQVAPCGYNGEVLLQLAHCFSTKISPLKRKRTCDASPFSMVETVGIEPMTSCMSSMRSNQLSYASVTDDIIAHHKSFVKRFLKSFLKNFEIF